MNKDKILLSWSADHTDDSFIFSNEYENASSKFECAFSRKNLNNKIISKIFKFTICTIKRCGFLWLRTKEIETVSWSGYLYAKGRLLYSHTNDKALLTISPMLHISNFKSESEIKNYIDKKLLENKYKFISNKHLLLL